MEMADRRERFEATALPLLSAVYGYAIRLVRNGDTARDLTQETYLRAYRTFDNFRPGTNCKAWLFTILYSIFANRYRRERRQPKMVSLEEVEERFQRSLQTAETDQSPTGPTAWTDPDVEMALGELPESFRATVLLVDVEELSYEETAVALNCPVGTVRSRLNRARKLLHGALADHARRIGYLRETGGGS
jgi:RNA polymerase sigma-70 factor (ECF subfamily)